MIGREQEPPNARRLPHKVQAMKMTTGYMSFCAPLSQIIAAARGL